MFGIVKVLRSAIHAGMPSKSSAISIMERYSPISLEKQAVD